MATASTCSVKTPYVSLCVYAIDYDDSQGWHVRQDATPVFVSNSALRFQFSTITSAAGSYKAYTDRVDFSVNGVGQRNRTIAWRGACTVSVEAVKDVNIPFSLAGAFLVGRGENNSFPPETTLRGMGIGTWTGFVPGAAHVPLEPNAQVINWVQDGSGNLVLVNIDPLSDGGYGREKYDESSDSSRVWSGIVAGDALYFGVTMSNDNSGTYWVVGAVGYTIPMTVVYHKPDGSVMKRVSGIYAGQQYPDESPQFDLYPGEKFTGWSLQDASQQDQPLIGPADVIPVRTSQQVDLYPVIEEINLVITYRPGDDSAAGSSPVQDTWTVSQIKDGTATFKGFDRNNPIFRYKGATPYRRILSWTVKSTAGAQATDGNYRLDGVISRSVAESLYKNGSLYPVWVRGQFTITFNANGGKVVLVSNEQVTVTQWSRYWNEPCGAPTLASRTGYTSQGWFTTAQTGGSQVDTATTYPTKDMTLYARWTANEYTVTFDTHGGSAVSTTATVKYDSKYGTLPTTARTGYSFKGWYTAESGGAKVTSDTDVKTAGDHTLHAQWEPVTYAITYHRGSAQDAVGTDHRQEFSIETLNQQITLLTASSGYFTRKGYLLHGWSTSPDGNPENWVQGAIYDFGAHPDHLRNRDLYPVWRVGSLIVTFDAHGGSVAPATATVTYGSKYGDLPTPARAGYSFAGWYTAESGGAKVTADTDVTGTADHVLHARWSGNLYELGYDNWFLVAEWARTYGAKGSKGGIEWDVDLTGAGSPMTLTRVGGSSSDAAFTPAGPDDPTGHYMFPVVGDGSRRYRLAMTFQWLGTVPDESTRVRVSLFQFDGNREPIGGAGSTQRTLMSKAAVLPGDTAANRLSWGDLVPAAGARFLQLRLGVTPFNAPLRISHIKFVDQIRHGDVYQPYGKIYQYSENLKYGQLSSPTRDASSSATKFLGWFTEVDGGGQQVGSGTVAPAASQTVFSHWGASSGAAPETVTVTYKPGGGSGSATTASAEVDSDGTIGLQGALFRWTGYQQDGWIREDTGVGCDLYGRVEVDGDLALVARWSANEYVVTFDAHGGSVAPATATVTYGSKYGALPTPTRAGYSFAGWYTAESGGARVTSSTTVATAADHVLHAQWSGNTYVIRFEMGENVEPREDLSVGYDSWQAISAPSRPGHRFAGWSVSGHDVGTAKWSWASGESASLAPEPARIVPTLPAGNLSVRNLRGDRIQAVTMTALWTGVQSEITFDANGGTGGSSRLLDVGAPLKPPEVARIGHRFTGWSPAVPETVPSSSAVYTAQWTAVQYDVVLAGLPDGAEDHLQMSYGTWKNVPNPPGVSWGTFAGWRVTGIDNPAVFGTRGSPVASLVSGVPVYLKEGDEVGHGVNVTAFNYLRVSEGVVTLTARWKRTPVDVTFDYGGAPYSPVVKSLAFGDPAELPADPSYAGYRFDGWYGPDGRRVNHGDVFVYSQPVTLTARWTEYGVESKTYTMNPGGSYDVTVERKTPHFVTWTHLVDTNWRWSRVIWFRNATQTQVNDIYGKLMAEFAFKMTGSENGSSDPFARWSPSSFLDDYSGINANATSGSADGGGSSAGQQSELEPQDVSTGFTASGGAVKPIRMAGTSYLDIVNAMLDLKTNPDAGGWARGWLQAGDSSSMPLAGLYTNVMGTLQLPYDVRMPSDYGVQPSISVNEFGLYDGSFNASARWDTESAGQRGPINSLFHIWYHSEDSLSMSAGSGGVVSTVVTRHYVSAAGRGRPLMNALIVLLGGGKIGATGADRQHQAHFYAGSHVTFHPVTQVWNMSLATGWYIWTGGTGVVS